MDGNATCILHMTVSAQASAAANPPHRHMGHSIAASFHSFSGLMLALSSRPPPYLHPWHPYLLPCSHPSPSIHHASLAVLVRHNGSPKK
ncbi:hypothetical protein H671_8g19703 [Cricetulus griseus]|uniref:Uncharacterized protein n=1 Tax=Cricetulus griseus TaxID=10029 RepID=A0A061HWG2_CRIGR|nr:hypothetical protein H671_8g19703 [Cricetulus griseus]